MKRLLCATLLAAASCAPRPKPVVVPPVVPAPSPTPSPTPLPGPAAVTAVPFREVPEPRLDVGVAVERAAFVLPWGEWLVRTSGSVRRVAGSVAIRPASAPATGTAATFQVQAGSFAGREPAAVEAARLGALLGIASSVADAGGRWGVRLGEPGPRAALEPLLARVRRDAVPDAFLVGLAPAGAPPRTLLVETGDGTLEVPSPVELQPVDGAPIPVGDARYRGYLRVVATPRGTLHVVNRVGLEEYLLGVVPLELGPRVYDELEAQKAQAVAARTYAVKRRGDFSAEGYDLCATARCQVYGGATAEQPLSTQAVKETAGQVLLFEGAPADALFTSTCGGRTEDAGVVFPSYSKAAFPYLRSVPCRGEERLALRGAAPSVPPRELSALALRGRALLGAAGRAGASWSDLKAARALLTARLGLPAGSPPKTLSPEAVCANLAGLLGDEALLTEPAERVAAPAGWSAEAGQVFTALVRFQLAGATPLPTARPLTGEETAGLWASILLRLGGLEEIEGRLVGAAGGKVVVKTAKGREERTLSSAFALYRGGGEAWMPRETLDAAPGDRVRLFAKDGEVVLLAAPLPSAEGLYERESGWIHWVRRFTGAELMEKLKERDASRRGSVVKDLDVLARGPSGRAARVRVTTDLETFELSGLEIRFALTLPESLFTRVGGTDASGAPVHTFWGRGWGHGVGLCQTGTFGMALAGRTHAEILAAYYPGASLGSWPPLAPDGTPASTPSR